MAKIKTINAISNELMTYDKDVHRYILTSKAALDLLGIDLAAYFGMNKDDSPGTQIFRFLDFISRHVYNYIYTHGNSKNRNVVEYALAKSKQGKDMIQQAMLNEVEYALSEGAFWNKSGINIQKNTAMDLSMLRDTRQVSADTDMLLTQVLDVLGVSVKYQGIIRVPFGMDWRNDY